MDYYDDYGNDEETIEFLGQLQASGTYLGYGCYMKGKGHESDEDTRYDDIGLIETELNFD